MSLGKNISATLLVSAAFPCLAMAQDTPQPDEGGGLNVIVVTAQKRSENLQDTPIAITAVSGEALEERGTRDISQLAEYTPNLVFDTTAPVSGVSSGAIVFIRGVGQTDFQLTTDPGVGTYVDGVYMARSVGGVLDVLDLERAEVLRGPQGTLFGRNTIGGAISLVSRAPDDAFGARVSATYGSRDRVEARAVIDAPLSDSVRTKFIGSYRRQDGYVRGLLDDRNLGDVNRLAFRGVLEADITSTLTATIAGDYTRINEQNAASKLVGISVQAPGDPTRTDIRFDRNTNSVTTESIAVPPGVPSLSFLFNVIDSPVFGLPQYDGAFITSDLDTTFATGPNGTRLDIWGASLTLDLDSEIGDIKSVSAFRRTTGSFARDADGSPLTFGHTENSDYQQQQFSQELQVSGTTSDRALKYAAGIYYFNETGQDILMATLPQAFGTVNNFTFVTNDSIAAYAQTTYNITSALSVTGGARYTSDTKEYRVPVGGGAVLNGLAGIFGPTGTLSPFFPPGRNKASFDNWSFTGVIDYKVADNLLIYANYSEGYKSGGFNTRYLVPVPAAISFAPEELTTYEAGIKFEGFDRRLRMNAAVFHSDYDDIQLVVYENGAPITRNAASADIRGIELELTAVPVDGLNFNFGLGYLDADYVSVRAIDPNVASDLQVTQDSDLPNTPELSMNGAISYAIAIGTLGELTMRGDWVYSSRIENDAVNSKFLTQPSYHMFNAGITYSHDDGLYSVTAFVDNITDRRILTSGDSNYGVGFHEANFNRPREFGVTIRAAF